MEILGIKFAPLSIPLERRLQTLAAGTAIMTILFGGLIGAIVLFYLIFYTQLWPAALFYLSYAYVLDSQTSETGGRSVPRVRSWLWWKYLKEYFPIYLERLPWIELDPKRNYLFCCFPHGVLPHGAFSAFSSNWGGFQDAFPYHTPHLLTVKINFLLPILRELFLALGMCSASSNSLNYLLSYPGGGKVAALNVGGAAEALHCKPDYYRIILKKRKGFVKIALENGSPLVPVFSFGETDLFRPLDSPEGSLIRRIQEWMKDLTGVAPIIPIGRGYLQYSFGLVPLRKPVYTVVGKPIDVNQVVKPTQQDIDDLHEEFVKQLQNLFEEQKYKYVANPEQTKLIID